MSDSKNKSFFDDFHNTEIPYFSMTNQIHIVMFSTKHLIIDGKFSVIEYGEEIIILKLKKGMLTIIGLALSISTVMEDKIVIIGEILSISFDR